VPNQALRFRPPQAEASGGIRLRPPHDDEPADSTPGNTVWQLRDGEPTRVPVLTGNTDGRYTEVLSNELAAGDEILIGLVSDGDRS
jgi:HlyD family secretion protein